jgi:hypothetical protein
VLPSRTPNQLARFRAGGNGDAWRTNRRAVPGLIWGLLPSTTSKRQGLWIWMGLPAARQPTGLERKTLAGSPRAAHAQRRVNGVLLLGYRS